MDAQENRSRKIALGAFGVVALLFILISAVSFDASRGRIDPATIQFQGQTAVDGKRVFQAYNCMGCHTVLGNGAYFAPDITGVYATNGPAWLMAWFSDPTVWPTQPTVEQWIANLQKSGDIAAKSADDYYATFDGAQADPVNRGGWSSIMPHLAFRDDEKAGLIAFMDYTSQINTQGWPPAPQANPTVVDSTQKQLWRTFPGAQPTAVPAPGK
ncbi:MAG: c-type cytochrome [Chloroflexota bacterium]|nr:c-type cytochrome [Chloroflexota bacterium]